MARTFDDITPQLASFLERQPVYFVATAPAGPEGHVNVSPKGLDTLRVLDPRTLAYLDLTGSGIETVAHLRDNGRITVMACSFEGPPNIVRVYGTGRAHRVDSTEGRRLLERLPAVPVGARAVVLVDVERVATSCGYGVPLMALQGARDRLTQWAIRKGDEGLVEYRRQENARSIDGLPGLDAESAP